MCDLIKFSPTVPRRSIFSRPALVNAREESFPTNLRDQFTRLSEIFVYEEIGPSTSNLHNALHVRSTDVVTRFDRAKYVSYSFGNDVHARVHAAAQVRSTLIDTHAFLVRSLSASTTEALFTCRSYLYWIII